MDLDTNKMLRIARAILSGDINFEAPAKRNSGVPLFLAGLATGVVVGVLFAPGAGEDTRSQIAERARQGFDSAKTKGQELGRRAQEAVNQGKEQVKEASKTAKDRYSDTPVS